MCWLPPSFLVLRRSIRMCKFALKSKAEDQPGGQRHCNATQLRHRAHQDQQLPSWIYPCPSPQPPARSLHAVLGFLHCINNNMRRPGLRPNEGGKSLSVACLSRTGQHLICDRFQLRLPASSSLHFFSKLSLAPFLSNCGLLSDPHFSCFASMALLWRILSRL